MMNIPLAKPYVDEREVEAVSEVIRSGWFSQGKRVQKFEGLMEDYLGCRYCVAVSSGTAALTLSLHLLGVGYRDEVICPAFTCMANANAIHALGATPVFADIDPQTFNVSPISIKRRINGKTKAIVAIHQIGLPADIDAIQEVSRGLPIIEDAACALGAEYKGKRVGHGANLTCFSFHPRKVLTTGEGGMIATDSAEFAERARAIRSHGISVSDLVRHESNGAICASCGEIGFNYRMTDMQAAMGIEQFKKLDYMLLQRKDIAECYDSDLDDDMVVFKPHVPEYAKHSYQSYLITLGIGPNRDELVNKMARAGISCRHGIPPLYREPCYGNKYKHLRLPHTEEAAATTMFLPIYPSMTAQEVVHVIETLKELL